MRALTVRQPYANLIVAGVQDVLNMARPVPSTLPRWWRCHGCQQRIDPSGRDPDPDQWRCVSAPRDPHDVYGRAGRPGATFEGPFPFTIAVHAGTNWSPQGWASAQRVAGSQVAPYGVNPGQYPLGAFVGTVDVTDCHGSSGCHAVAFDMCSPWSESYNVYHWTLANPVQFDTPIPAKGRSGLWIMDDKQTDQVRG